MKARSLSSKIMGLRNAGVLAGWPAGVPRLRPGNGGEDAAWPAAETAALL